MSIRLWEEIAKQKEEVENQRRRILNTFKANKINREMGSLKAERLFKPITERLEAARPQGLRPAAPQEKPEQAAFDYGDDELQNWEALPFGEVEEEDFLAPAPAPAPDEDEIFSLVGAEGKKPDDFFDPEDEGVLPGEKRSHSEPNLPSYSESTRPPPPYKKRSEETNDLSTLEKFLKENKDKPNAMITTEKSKFYGWTVEQANYRRYEIYTGRAEEVLTRGRKSIGQKSLGPYEGKSNNKMREMIDKFRSGQAKPKTGSGAERAAGFGSLRSLIQRLTLGISSIFAGNSSLKLREEVKAIGELLFKHGIISKEQKTKIMSLK